MNDGHVVIGYHGCDVTTRDALVSGRTQPRESKNQYDWLGPGFYMFEGDHDRALSFAQRAHEQPEKRYTAVHIATPAVVGCVFCVQHCLDMTTRKARIEFLAGYEFLTAGGKELPVNSPPSESDPDGIRRPLDRAVISMVHEARTIGGLPAYQAVRGAFRQGPELLPASGFHHDSHVQIALRDFLCVLGWFVPPGANLLTDEEYRQAQEALQDFKAAHPKKKVRSQPMDAR